MDGSHLRNAESSLSCYSIVVKDNEVSENGFDKLVQSSLKVENDFSVKRFDAAVPKDVAKYMKKDLAGIQWTWPWQQPERCLATGLTKSPYPTTTPHKRIACFISHFLLWKKCLTDQAPILVLEHDAIFIKKLDLNILDVDYDIIGINNPIGATRKHRQYDDMIQSKKTSEVIPVPRIDQFDIPQGLAGNSAYIVKPAGAKSLIDKVKEIGAWPNDALMCYQNIKRLGVSTTYYTQVQGLPSTTTL